MRPCAQIVRGEGAITHKLVHFKAIVRKNCRFQFIQLSFYAQLNSIVKERSICPALLLILIPVSDQNPSMKALSVTAVMPSYVAEGAGDPLGTSTIWMPSSLADLPAVPAHSPFFAQAIQPMSCAWTL